MDRGSYMDRGFRVVKPIISLAVILFAVRHCIMWYQKTSDLQLEINDSISDKGEENESEEEIPEAKYYVKDEPVVEVSVGDIESAFRAAAGGANSIELCADRGGGGVTPSLGLILTCVRNVNAEIHVLIRPRVGNFCYSDREFEVILSDIMLCKRSGVHGIVVGILTKTGEIDVERMKIIRQVSKGMLLTFHRAFDTCELSISKLPVSNGAGVERGVKEEAHAEQHTDDALEVVEIPSLECEATEVEASDTTLVASTTTEDIDAVIVNTLECLISLGCDRLLTSGQATTALLGGALIRTLVEQAGSRIRVVAGCGISSLTVRGLIEQTGVKGVHVSSAVHVLQSDVQEDMVKEEGGTAMAKENGHTLEEAAVSAVDVTTVASNEDAQDNSTTNTAATTDSSKVPLEGTYEMISSIITTYAGTSGKEKNKSSSCIAAQLDVTQSSDPVKGQQHAFSPDEFNDVFMVSELKVRELYNACIESYDNL